jgi:hypothetical protein
VSRSDAAIVPRCYRKNATAGTALAAKARHLVKVPAPGAAKDRPHPEERALARVSKDGRERSWRILRDAARAARLLRMTVSLVASLRGALATKQSRLRAV